MQITALYPGTFDPFTNGHYDLVLRASHLFDRVIVAIAASKAKKPLFTLGERVTMTAQILEDLANVEVCGFENLMVDFADSLNANVIVRGLRAVSDFEYEVQLAGLNRNMRPEIETVYLTPDQQHSNISSSLVKDIASHGGNVDSFVDPLVAKALQKKLK